MKVWVINEQDGGTEPMVFCGGMAALPEYLKTQHGGYHIDYNIHGDAYIEYTWADNCNKEFKLKCWLTEVGQ